MLEFRILGPLEVIDNGRTIPLGGTKQRAALAILLLSSNRVVSIERFADDLYAGEPPVTAVTQVQRQVSELRKAIGTEAIETRSPGYVLHVEPGALDLDRFEQMLADAADALERMDAAGASDLLGRALGLWRGAPLGDLTYESFAQPFIARLEELRLVALEERFEAELALGRHAQVLPELEALVWDNPLRERLRGQLMLALYRSGRQADALDQFRRTRESLIEEFGIEPSASLRELERLILRQDASLDLARSEPQRPAERAILAVASREEQLSNLCGVAERLARLPGRSVLLAFLVGEDADLAGAASAVKAFGERLAVPTRSAAFTSLEPARDVVRLAVNYEADLILIDGDLPPGLIDRSPSDLAQVHGAVDWQRGAGIYVPFGGNGDDWAALEVGAWLAAGMHAPLMLVGTKADASRGRRDASRLLADASLAVQRVVGIAAEPVLAEASEFALAAAVADATVVVSSARDALLAAGPPVVLVRSGQRPGGLAPRGSRTQFTWSLES